MTDNSVETVWRAFVAAIMIVAAAYLGYFALRWFAARYSQRYPGLPALIDKARRPFRLMVALIAARIVSNQIAHIREGWVDGIDHILQIAMIGALVWLAVAAVSAVEEQVLKNDLKRDRDPVDRRRFQTQISLLRRLLVAGLFAIGVISVLLTFPAVKSVGTSLLASAGLISIVAGLAAQTTLTNVFAGLQLALSDTVRVGDVIVINQQSGTVKELTLTHVEMRLWDGRVLILPSSFFISQPFENWTRTLNQIGGSVFMDVDWSTPVEEVRQEVTRILEHSDLWDGRRNFVLVANVVGATMQLQIGVSAANTENLFELQSLVREKISEFLIRQHPDSIVRNRTQALPVPDAPLPEPQTSEATSGESDTDADRDSDSDTHQR